MENKLASSLGVSLGKALNGTPHLYVEDRWPLNLEKGNSQASADFPSKAQRYILLSCEWRINMANKTKPKNINGITATSLQLTIHNLSPTLVLLCSLYVTFSNSLFHYWHNLWSKPWKFSWLVSLHGLLLWFKEKYRVKIILKSKSVLQSNDSFISQQQ